MEKFLGHVAKSKRRYIKIGCKFSIFSVINIYNIFLYTTYTFVATYAQSVMFLKKINNGE